MSWKRSRRLSAPQRFTWVHTARARDAFADCAATGARMQGRERGDTLGSKAGIVPVVLDARGM